MPARRYIIVTIPLLLAVCCCCMRGVTFASRHSASSSSTSNNRNRNSVPNSNSNYYRKSSGGNKKARELKLGCTVIDNKPSLAAFDGRINGSGAEGTVPLNAVEEVAPAAIAFLSYMGSVTHYYHFLLGALVPFIEYLTRPRAYVESRYTIATDLGPMKRLIFELPLVLEEAVDRELDGMISDRLNFNKSLLGQSKLPQHINCITHSTLMNSNASSSYEKSRQKELSGGIYILPSYDMNQADLSKYDLDSQLSPESRRRVLAYLDSTMPPYVLELPTYDIVLVQRHFDPTYTADALGTSTTTTTTGSGNTRAQAPSSHKRTRGVTGDLRRNISNHNELSQALNDRVKAIGSYTFKNIIFDRFGLYYQYHLFRSARVVVAQHGAVLGNIFFMRGAVDDIISSNSSNSSIDTNTKTSATTRTDTRKQQKSFADMLPHTYDIYPSCVIEITPPREREYIVFKSLAKYLGVGYKMVEQSTQWGPVDINAIVKAFNETSALCL